MLVPSMFREFSDANPPEANPEPSHAGWPHNIVLLLAIVWSHLFVHLFNYSFIHQRERKRERNPQQGPHTTIHL